MLTRTHVIYPNHGKYQTVIGDKKTKTFRTDKKYKH